MHAPHPPSHTDTTHSHTLANTLRLRRAQATFTTYTNACNSNAMINLIAILCSTRIRIFIFSVFWDISVYVSSHSIRGSQWGIIVAIFFFYFCVATEHSNIDRRLSLGFYLFNTYSRSSIDAVHVAIVYVHIVHFSFSFFSINFVSATVDVFAVWKMQTYIHKEYVENDKSG